MPHHCFLGLDGGSHKTLGVLIDQEGEVLACVQGEGSSIGPEPAPERCAVLSGLKVRLCEEAGVEPGEIAGVGLGLSGIDFADEFEHQYTVLSKWLGVERERLALVNDGVVALWGASPAENAVIVHHGSGITHAYRTGYGQEQAYDHLDVGKMFDIRQGLAAVVARMLDGRVPPTPLKEAVLRHYGLEESNYADNLFRNLIPRERFRTAQMHAWTAWGEGDPAATGLVEQAAADYVLTALAMARRTGDPRCEVAFGGGVINHAPEEFMALLVAGVQAELPEAAVIRPRLSPGHGAALMAAFQAGVDTRPLFARMVREAQ